MEQHLFGRKTCFCSMIKRGGGLRIVKKTPCTKLEWGVDSELLMGFGSDCLTLNSSSRPDCGQQDAATHSVTQQCNRECNTRVENSATQLSNRWMGRSAVLRCSGSRTTYPPAAPAQHQQTNRELGNYNSAIPSLGLLSIYLGPGLDLAKIILLFFEDGQHFAY